MADLIYAGNIVDEDKYAGKPVERMQQAEKVLDVRDLSVTLFTEDGPLPALQDVSFVMRKGETLAVEVELSAGTGETDVNGHGAAISLTAV